MKSQFTEQLVRMWLVRSLLYSKGFIIANVGDVHVIFQSCYHCFVMQNFELSPDGKLLAVCGRFGKIHLLAVNTLEGAGVLKMNSEVSAVAFDNDGSHIFSHGGIVFYLN
jgi:WD40 repeat protein